MSEIACLQQFRAGLRNAKAKERGWGVRPFISTKSGWTSFADSGTLTWNPNGSLQALVVNNLIPGCIDSRGAEDRGASHSVAIRLACRRLLFVYFYAIRDPACC